MFSPDYLFSYSLSVYWWRVFFGGGEAGGSVTDVFESRG